MMGRAYEVAWCRLWMFMFFQTVHFVPEGETETLHGIGCQASYFAIMEGQNVYCYHSVH